MILGKCALGDNTYRDTYHTTFIYRDMIRDMIRNIYTQMLKFSSTDLLCWQVSR